MSDTVFERGRLGDLQIPVVDHTGPASYTTGGEVIGTTNNFSGISVAGIGGIAAIVADSISDSGNYVVAAQPTGTGMRKTFNLKWSYAPGNPASSPAGTPLSLGTLSAAQAGNSTYTTAGLFTVAGQATPPAAGTFVVHSAGASGKGIFMDGIPVYVATSTPGTGYTFNFGQAEALNFAAAADTLKWQQVQVSPGNPLQALPLAAPITGVLATANLLTITQANSLVPGQFVYLNGPFKTASVYALGAIVQVQTASATGWAANWQGTIIAQTSGETAVASLLVTNGNAPISASPYVAGPSASISNVLTVASAAAAAGLFTLTATQGYLPGQLAVVQSVATASQLNGSIGSIIATGLTSALIKMQGWTVLVSTAGDTGIASLLVTGPSSGEVAPGTNLSGETVRLGYIGR